MGWEWNQVHEGVVGLWRQAVQGWVWRRLLGAEGMLVVVAAAAVAAARVPQNPCGSA